MEEEVTKKSKGFKIAVIILTIIAIGLIGYIVYDEMKMKEAEKENTETTNQEQNKEEIEENIPNIENSEPTEQQLSVTDPIVLEAMSLVYRTSITDPGYYASSPILTPANKLTNRDLVSIITSYAYANHYIENPNNAAGGTITIENVKKIFSNLFGDQIEYRHLYCDELNIVNVFCYNPKMYNDRYMLAGGTGYAMGNTTTKAIDAKTNGDYLYVIVKSMRMEKEIVPDERYFFGRTVNQHYYSYGSDQPFYSGMDLTDIQVFEQYESKIEKYQTIFVKGSDGKYHFNRSEKIVE